MAEDTSLLALAIARARDQAPSRCTIGKLLMSHEKATQIKELVDNSGQGHGEEIQYGVAGAILSEAVGQKIDGQTISRHVRRKCNCP